MWRATLGIAGLIAAVGLMSPLAAQGLLDKVRKGAQTVGGAVEKGASDVGGAVVQGADAVGNAVSRGADAVGDTVDSTVDLASNEATPAETRAKLDAMAQSVLGRLLSENAEAAAMFETCAGYAVFDSRKVSVFPVAAGFGRGVAVSRPEGHRTYMNMGTGGVGAAVGIGGFATQFVAMFETRADFTDFVINGYDASAESGAMMGEDRAEGTIGFIDGRSVFVLGKKGWRVNAGLSGTKYWPSPELN